MTQKIPPPPPIASGNLDDFVRSLPSFNRWLIELTSILASGGGIDPETIDGYPALQNQVAANTAAISTLQSTSGGQSFAILLLQAQVGTLTTGLAAANANITALAARAQVLNGALGGGVPSNALGADNDWFYNRTGAAGNRLFIKLAGAWAAQAI